MIHPLIEKRDELIKRLQHMAGVVSVGLAKRSGDVVLLVAVNNAFSGEVPKVFNGVGVVVEDLGEAQVEFKEN
jgi:hypothetical protein